jgi:MerR family transcriptional regulator, light-induced transcriptional regulator
MVTESFYRKYQEQLLRGERKACSRMVDELLDQGISMKEIFVDLFQRSLYEVGYLWETNQISVAHEHLCTSITETLVSQVYPRLFAEPHNGQQAVVTCTPGEYHQVGPRMVADFFELHGWDAHFLGANTPENDLVKFIRAKQPGLIAISMSVFFHLASLQQLVKVVKDAFPDLPVLLGGQAFRWGGTDAFSGQNKVKVILSLDELENQILRK